MFILIGLGNPGEKYHANRHNIGFIFADWIKNSNEHFSEWKYDKYLDADIAKASAEQASSPIGMLAKPRTFMNRSGFTANKILASQQLPLTDLIVVHDDLDIRLGEFKIQQGKGPKVHNGLSSIESSLRYKDFWRVRIGIDNRDATKRTPGEPYVLQNFTLEESNQATELFPIIFLKLQEILKAQEQS